MKPPTEKQIRAATAFFNRHATLGAAHGCPTPFPSYREEMIAIGYNPDCRHDMSRYIGMFIVARNDARMALGFRPTRR